MLTQTSTHSYQCTVRPVHSQTSTQSDQYTVGPVHIQTSAQSDQYTVRPVLTQTSTHSDQYTFRSVHSQPVQSGATVSTNPHGCFVHIFTAAPRWRRECLVATLTTYLAHAVECSYLHSLFQCLFVYQTSRRQPPSQTRTERAAVTSGEVAGASHCTPPR